MNGRLYKGSMINKNAQLFILLTSEELDDHMYIIVNNTKSKIKVSYFQKQDEINKIVEKTIASSKDSILDWRTPDLIKQIEIVIEGNKYTQEFPIHYEEENVKV